MTRMPLKISLTPWPFTVACESTQRTLPSPQPLEIEVPSTANYFTESVAVDLLDRSRTIKATSMPATAITGPMEAQAAS